jgi:hypothetical protein
MWTSQTPTRWLLATASWALIGMSHTHSSVSRFCLHRLTRETIQQTGTRYDAELHARNQLKHGSWVLKIQNA